MRQVLERRITAWLDDPDSAVQYAEEVEERWAVRVAQSSRDATTVWFWPRARSMEIEAYFMPVAEKASAQLRQALIRNYGTWRVFFALDPEGGLVLRGRIASSEVTFENLDAVLGEIVEMVDVAFRAMLRAGTTDRENSV